MRTLYTYITILLLVASCGTPESETCHRRITFYNNYHKDTYIDCDVPYADTTYILKHASAILSQAHINKTLSGQANGYAITNRGCIEDLFNRITDTLVCFVFDADVLENESTQTIVDNYLVLQRYDLSLDDAKQLNWTLPFPPTEEMKYMRMYPPYGTYNK